MGGRGGRALGRWDVAGLGGAVEAALLWTRTGRVPVGVVVHDSALR